MALLAVFLHAKRTFMPVAAALTAKLLPTLLSVVKATDDPHVVPLFEEKLARALPPDVLHEATNPSLVAVPPSVTSAVACNPLATVEGELHDVPLLDEKLDMATLLVF